MVWFQCEDCGEDLKKPKLPNHFRICSAYKLSCIDCGEVFGQQTVQSHTQCITEAEKYGPKGQGKVSNSANAKSNKNAKQQPDFDINVGLSERPPWFCSLCNTSATSRQTLLLHAEGKKHRAKARAHHAAKQPKTTGEAQQVTADNNSKSETVNNNNVEESKDLPKGDAPKVDSETTNGNLLSSKKRKNHGYENDGPVKKIAGDSSGEAMNGEVVQVERIKKEEKERSSKKVKLNEQKEEKLSKCVFNNTNEEPKSKIKWKKLIKLALKSNPDGVLKFRKLRKIVLQTLRESGVLEDEIVLTNTLEHKLELSSRFTVDGKYIRLKIKD